MKLKGSIYIAMFGTLLGLSACTAEQDGLLNEVPQNDSAIVEEGEMTSFSTRGDAFTRTYLDDHSSYSTPLANYHFHWSVGDRVFLKVGQGTADSDYLRARRANITNADQWADFFFVGHFNEETYPVYYTGLEMHNTGSDHLTEDGKLPNTNGQSAKQVTIAPVQVQFLPNRGQHLATSGDCATGTATRVTDSSLSYDYEFTLTHRASYLIFKPYTDVRPLYDRIENGIDNAYCYLRKIKVEKIDGNGSHLCGTYNFGDPDVNTGGLDMTPANVTNPRDSILLYCNNYMQKPVVSGASGYEYDWTVTAAQEIKDMDLENKPNRFKLSNVQGDALGIDMVIQPGNHKLRVTYTFSYFQLQEPVYTNKWEYNHHDQVKEYSVDIPLKNYAENTYYVVQHQLPIQDMEPDFIFDMQSYYQWGATDHYWTDVSINNIPNANNKTYRFAPATNAWSNETNPLENNQATSTAFSNTPNVNEMTYYIQYGDVHHDLGTKWWMPHYLTVPTLSTGGIWMKKKAVIEAEGHTFNPEMSVAIGNSTEEPRDLRNSPPVSDSDNAPYRLNYADLPAGNDAAPADDVRDNYFFLPRTGYFESTVQGSNELSAKLKQMGSEGLFWTSTRYPKFSFNYPTTTGVRINKTAYSLYINDKPIESGGQYVGISYQPDSNHPRRQYGMVAGKRPVNGYVGYRGIGAGGTEWFQ